MKIYPAGVPGGGTSGLCRRERELNSFWNKRLWTYYWLTINNGIMPKTNKVELMLDSGAFSAWNKGATINLQEYITFCLDHYEMLDYIVNLDVIPSSPYQKVTKEDSKNSVKQGWGNYKTMLNAGISKDKLIHVFHQGEDMKWLKRMVKQIPYIGVSPANDKTTQQKILWLDECMDYVTDNQGTPIVKFHGFGVTSLRIMLRYPWYSVDSTSWVVTGRMGSIYIPRYKGGKWIYDENSWKIAVSNRSPNTKEAGKHIETLPPTEKHICLDYIHNKGYELGKSEFKEVNPDHVLVENERWAEKKEKDQQKRLLEIIVEPGISNKYQLRDEMNIIYFLDLEKSMPEWPWAFKKKGVTNGFF